MFLIWVIIILNNLTFERVKDNWNAYNEVDITYNEGIYRLKVEAIGNVFKIFLNEIQYIDYTDNLGDFLSFGQWHWQTHYLSHKLVLKYQHQIQQQIEQQTLQYIYCLLNIFNELPLTFNGKQ